MIISRYLLREILGPLVVALGVLCALFTSFGAAAFLSDAVNGLLPMNMIFQVIGLRTLIALEVLIPISLYLAVVMALGRLYADSEMTALFALGLTTARLMGIVLGLSLCMAVIVAGLSLVVRPWAYARSHQLASLAAASLNTQNMQAGTFYGGKNGVQFEDVGLEILLACISQKLPRQGRSSVGRLTDFSRIFAQGVPRWEIAEQNFTLADDGRQDAVELVCDTARQFANGFHFLRLK